MNARPAIHNRPARGLVTAVAMLFLIATVVFALAVMLNNSGNAVVDGQRQADSTAAFFAAETGLEAGTAAMLGNNVIDSGVCSNSETNVAVGPRATYSRTGSLQTNPPCGGSGQPACTDCVLQSTGKVGAATRTVEATVGLRLVDGVTCTVPSSGSTACANNPLTWWLDLKNRYATDAVGVFSLAVGKQGANTGAGCTNPSCVLVWDSKKMTGTHAVQSMGNVVPIPAGQSYKIYQTGSTENLSQVGMIFRGTSQPVVTGRRLVGGTAYNGTAYWDATNANNTATVSKSPATLLGETNDGTATDSATQTCLDAAGNNSAQTCTSWCYGGDTLVFGFAAEATSLADDITSVTFNTTDTGTTRAQNIGLTPFITDRKFPTATSPGSPPTDVYTSLWWVRNFPYTSPANVRSGALVTGQVNAKANFTGSIGNNSTTLTVASFSGTPIVVGDVLAGNIDAGTVVCSITTGTGGNGTYEVSSSGSCSPKVGQGSNRNSRPMSVGSTTLTVSAASIASLGVGDTIFGTGVTSGTKISALGTGTGGIGTYTLSKAQVVASTALTSDGMVVTATGGTVAPVAGTILGLFSGTGKFGPVVAGSTNASEMPTSVSSSPAPTATSFKLSRRPEVPLASATLCGGTCAFFVHGGTGRTQFKVAKTNDTLSWASGFVCLKGVTYDPEKVVSSRISTRRWSEQVQ